ncbi:MAG: trypsin-like peptidase domain-containing protein [Chloroflexota bacterium]
MKRIAGRLFLISLVLLVAGGCSGSGIGILPAKPEAAPEREAPVDERSQKSELLDPTWKAPPLENRAAALGGTPDVVNKVVPSVVLISTESATPDVLGLGQTQKAAGSGFIIDSRGYVVTNSHVVAGAKQVTVKLRDGTAITVAPDKVHNDVLSDVAVIKIEAQGLVAVRLADSSQLKLGEDAIAMGNALGLGLTVTRGVVSALGVSVPVSAGQTLSDLIQVDAPINPGNSGGPLVNDAGQVVGITSAKVAMSGIEGMGYAISTRTALPIIEELITRGYVVRPWLGVTMQTVDEWLALINRLPVNSGALVIQVERDSPADQAGLRKGDIIVAFDGKEIKTTDALREAIHSRRVGDSVEITYVRDSDKTETRASLRESPPVS